MTATVMGAGLFALIFGIRASRAFVEIGGGGSLVRLLGLLLFAGGVLVFGGITRWGLLIHMIGELFTAAGAVIYGAGAVIGLGWNGVVAGSFAFGLAIGSLLHVYLMVHSAKVFYRSEGSN
jgi:hypothetical protein